VNSVILPRTIYWPKRKNLIKSLMTYLLVNPLVLFKIYPIH